MSKRCCPNREVACALPVGHGYQPCPTGFIRLQRGSQKFHTDGVCHHQAVPSQAQMSALARNQVQFRQPPNALFMKARCVQAEPGREPIQVHSLAGTQAEHDLFTQSLLRPQFLDKIQSRAFASRFHISPDISGVCPADPRDVGGGTHAEAKGGQVLPVTLVVETFKPTFSISTSDPCSSDLPVTNNQNLSALQPRNKCCSSYFG